MVDSELALWKDWTGDSDERKELLPWPFVGTCDPGEQTSSTSAARGASDQGGSGGDTNLAGGRRKFRTRQEYMILHSV